MSVDPMVCYFIEESIVDFDWAEYGLDDVANISYRQYAVDLAKEIYLKLENEGYL